MDNKKIIYYWNMKSSLDKLNYLYITHIHLISITFSFNKDKMPYIYMNNHSPYHVKYDNVWEQLEIIANKGINIILVIGGSNDTLVNLFSYYDIFISILIQFLKDKCNIINVIDIIIDNEYTELVNIQKCVSDINKLTKIFYNKKFIISMMPYCEEMINNILYKELYNSKEGKFIDYFNCITYNDNNLLECFDKIIKHGFLPNKINIGCVYIKSSNDYYIMIENIKKKYKYIGGICMLNYYKNKNNVDYYIKLALSSV